MNRCSRDTAGGCYPVECIVIVSPDDDGSPAAGVGPAIDVQDLTGHEGGRLEE
jgi:hypothetical protein